MGVEVNKIAARFVVVLLIDISTSDIKKHIGSLVNESYEPYLDDNQKFEPGGTHKFKFRQLFRLLHVICLLTEKKPGKFDRKALNTDDGPDFTYQNSR